jgi:hypothetical protein
MDVTGLPRSSAREARSNAATRSCSSSASKDGVDEPASFSSGIPAPAAIATTPAPTNAVVTTAA